MGTTEMIPTDSSIFNDTGNDTDNFTNVAMPERGILPEMIIVPVIATLVVIVGLVGNILVILVVVRNRDHYKNTTNVFILNLAVSDILFISFCVPFHASIYIMPQWIFGDFMCRFAHFFQFSSMVTSICTLVAMSFDRYLAVAHPLKTKHLRRPKFALIVLFCAWAIGIAIAMPLPIVYSVKVYTKFGPEPISLCADKWAYPSQRKYYMATLVFISYAVPALFLIVFNSLLIKTLWTGQHPEIHSRSSSQQKRRVTLMVVVIVIVFLICWFPFQLKSIWSTFFIANYGQVHYYQLQLSAHLLSYSNSSMNPILYAFLSANFRRRIKMAIGRQSPPASNSTEYSRVSVSGRESTRIGSRKNGHQNLTKLSSFNEINRKK